MSTFVSVGNAVQPFSRLLDEVSRLVPQLPGPVFVQHGRTPFTGVGCEARAFVGMDDFASRIEHAKLVIVHAGAGSVIHAVRAGKVPVVVPRQAKYGEHIDDHQVEFALELAKAGKAVVAIEPEELADAVTRAIERQSVPRASENQCRMIEMVRSRLAFYEAAHTPN